MARTKQEVRNWLNAQVGKKVKDKSDSRYDGQCVAFGKALLEFLGAPNPYSARGNAKYVGDTLLRQGIAKKGRGWLTVCVNRSMGRGYGHIWYDLKNEANYEQNGARALHVTKGTRPYSQAQQILNLDKYIKADPKPAPKPSGSTYTVRKDDTMSGIAAKYKMTLAALGKLNSQVKNLNQIDVGQKINVKATAPAKKYITVRSGWGLSNIAQAAGFKDAWSEARWAAIARLNGSSGWQIFNRRLKPGQKVRVK